MSTAERFRTERDSLGEIQLPSDCLYGVHTTRAVDNFALSGRGVDTDFISAYATVKRACFFTNQSIGAIQLNTNVCQALVTAMNEMEAGELNDHVVVDAMQGGAGTSLNMNVNEVLANRALQLLGHPPGDYNTIDPLAHLNLHQSTNDTFPTALKLAAMRKLAALEANVVLLQEAFQKQEKRFAHVVKIGRTQLQDAVPTTLGRSMGAYAEALSRDRWRIYKCTERLRVVNLGGTAIGTGMGAPKKYIFNVTDTLRQLTGFGFARAENLLECTQNADVFVEVSGILKAHATTLKKIAEDLRLLSSGPEAGLNEVTLPSRQAGSSIMPGKVNPVIPESVAQVAMQVMGNDAVVANAVSGGNLELSQYLPLVADNLLSSLSMLANANGQLADKCVGDMTVNEENCAAHVRGTTGIVTTLVSRVGYAQMSALVAQAMDNGKPIADVIVAAGLVSRDELDALLAPESVCKLGD